MKQLTYSQRAEKDLEEIAKYTVRKWGESQADRYVEELEAACQRLVDQPFLGRFLDPSGSEIRRLEQGSHVIFYRLREYAIYILI